MQSSFNILLSPPVGAYPARQIFRSIVLVILTSSGCCQPLIRVVPTEPCSNSAGVSIEELSCPPTIDCHDGEYMDGEFREGSTLLHRLQLGQRIGKLSSKASSCIHDNYLKRKIDAHRAEKLAAKNAPPWPSFHPIPIEPVFFAREPIPATSESLTEGMTSNYGQFKAPENH